MNGTDLDALANVLAHDVSKPHGHRPTPLELADLSGFLRRLSKQLPRTGSSSIESVDVSTEYARVFVDFILQAVADLNPTEAKERLLGLSQGLAVAVAYAAAVQRDAATGRYHKRDMFSRDEVVEPGFEGAGLEKLDNLD